MLYVQHIESNAKGGVDCDLSPKTFIVGPNESGKSAVQNAVEIALTGRASDVYGRQEMGKEGELIAHLAPGRKGELYARASLSDGTQAIWQAGAKGAKRAKHTVPGTVDPEAVMPLRAVRAAVLGNAETARKFFLQFAVGAVSDRDVLTRIPDALHGHYRRAVLAAGLADAPVDKLLLALEKAKKEKRAANDRAKASKAASNDAAQGLAPLPTEEAVKALQTQHKEAKSRLDVMKAAVAATGALDRTRTQFAALKEQANMVEQENIRAQAALAETEERLKLLPTPATVDDTFKALVHIIDWHAGMNMNDGYCRVCGKNATPAEFAARQEAARRFAAKATDDAQTYQNALAVRDAAKMTALTCADRLATLKTQVSAMENALGSAQSGGGPDPAAVATAEAEVAKLDDALRNVDVLKAQWSASKRADDNATEAEKEADAWESLAEACVKAVGTLLDTGVSAFAMKVQGHLPKDDRFRITLRDGDRAIFQFGLEKEGGLIHTAMSGAAWARVTAAIADACAPPPEKLSVVVPVPGEFDPDTLSRVLAAFTGLRSQVLFCSPILPSVMPAGWTVVDTGRLGHRAGKVATVTVQAPAATTSAEAAQAAFDPPTLPPPEAPTPSAGAPLTW